MKEGRHKKTSLEKYSPLTLLQGFERVVEGLHVRGCWRPNVNFIFWPHCYDRHIVSCSPDVGVHSIGAFQGPPRSDVAFPYHIWSLLSGIILATASGVSEVPLGRVWPSLQHLVSNPLGFCWQLHRGFPRSPSAGCGLPYHISSLTLWESAGNCIGGFLSAPSVGCGLAYHIWSLLSGIRLATASGVSEVPLGRVWPSLPHLVSNPLGVCWQLLWHPKLNWVK